MTQYSAPSPSKSIGSVDLFCGAGGLTRGLLDAGILVVAGVDSDENCRYPYETNNRHTAFHATDVAKLKASSVKKWLAGSDVKVLAGCAPCQPFSNYSQRYEVVETPRWTLLRQFGRLVKEVQPDVVTMENVPSVIRHKVFTDFVETLKREGYQIWCDVVDCADLGLPQRRKRTVLLASRLGPISLQVPRDSTAKSVEGVLKGLPQLRHGRSNRKDPLHAASKLSPLNLKRIQASKPGGSWRDWPEDLVAKCHRKKSGKSYSGVYGRMEWSQPAPTLTTQFFGFGSGRFGHPSQSRGLSLREGAILQGFPKTYKFVPDGERVQFKVLGRLIGNAVPVHLGRAIGKSIVAHVAEHAHEQKE